LIGITEWPFEFLERGQKAGGIEAAKVVVSLKRLYQSWLSANFQPKGLLAEK